MEPSIWLPMELWIAIGRRTTLRTIQSLCCTSHEFDDFHTYCRQPIQWELLTLHFATDKTVRRVHHTPLVETRLRGHTYRVHQPSVGSLVTLRTRRTEDNYLGITRTYVVTSIAKSQGHSRHGTIVSAVIHPVRYVEDYVVHYDGWGEHRIKPRYRQCEAHVEAWFLLPQHALPQYLVYTAWDTYQPRFSLEKM